MRRHVLTAAIAAVAGLSALPSTAMSAPICRGGAVGTTSLFICVEVQPNQAGTTVAPEVYFCPIINGRPDACVSGPVAELGTTGFQPNPRIPLPSVDPATGTVSFPGGTLGWVLVNGIRTALAVPPFCVGDPAAC